MDKIFAEVIALLWGKIPDDQLDSNVDVYRYSSPTIALECLCSQIDDHKIAIDRHVFEHLRKLCEAKGVDCSYLDSVKIQLF